jgi:large subunit ribosomal protein L22
MALAQAYDVNVSYKDLCAVCDAIRYLKVGEAFQVLDGIETKQMPIQFKRFNKHMGARHELHGRKGAYPIAAAKEVRKVLTNATANARNKGMALETLAVAHASSNKTHIERRGPSKGKLFWGRGMYGMSPRVHSDIEYSKIEIGVAATESEKKAAKKAKPAEKAKAKAEAPAKDSTKKK